MEEAEQSTDRNEQGANSGLQAGEEVTTMDKTAINQITALLRSKNISASDIKRANETVAANGLRISELQTALYFANNGDLQQAKVMAGRAATAIQRLL